ncbi:MAG: adhesin HecA family, partial [Alphaproteobacteria bacterium]|nr:adhesin HecA family [Alphaproteobacteria bacterium]
KTWVESQSYNGGTPTDKPTLVAGSTLTIDSFQNVNNLGGIISGSTVNISSSKPGATFTNDDYHLTTKNWQQTWTQTASCCSDVIYLDYSTSTPVSSIASTTTTPFGAGIYATTLNGSGFSLVNAGSPYASSPTAPTGPGGATATGTLGGVNFGGFTIALPTNPNGLFIPSKDPNSKYLIETNPLYLSGSSFFGSAYLMQRYGIDPDNIQKRLGDANYEAYLIKQQLLQMGAAGLMDASDEGGNLQKLMDSALVQGQDLGLEFGKAPTSDQLSKMTGDMVWMVEQEVNGEKVLAPVVYLSAATQAMITGGAVISAKDMHLQIASLDNTGGSITASNNMNVTSQGNITNTSGTIQGGNVNLTSTGGSIVNQTLANTTGGEGNQATTIGKTATIGSTNNLNLDAKQDIVNKGANMSAGGDASLKAGNNITFDTIEDKKSGRTQEGSNNSFAGGSASTGTNSSTTNIKSGLSAGGNLNSESGNDTTFAGTDVNVGGNADVKAGGNLNIINREDSNTTTSTKKTGSVFSGSSTSDSKTDTTNVGSAFNVGGNLTTKSTGDTTIQGSKVSAGGNGDMQAGGNFNVLDGKNTTKSSSSSTQSGVGVGSGVYGIEGEQTDAFKSKSVASELSFGGNGKIASDKTLTIQGSDVSTGGDMALKGKDVNIVEGRDIDTSTTTKTNIDFLSTNSSTNENHQSGSESGTDGASASASASASSERGGSGNLSIMNANVTRTDNYKSTAVGSNIKSGGNMTIESENDTLLRGANVEAGGDVGLSGKNINIEAAKDVETSKISTTNASVGFFADSKNQVNAGADASASADQGGASATGKGSMNGAGAGFNGADASAEAEANATAGASTDNTIDLMRTKTTETETKDVTHQGTTIKSGGNMNVNAQNQLNVKGSDLEAGGDATIKAKDMSFTAAEDSHTSTTKTNATSAGLYNGASAEANANVNADASAKGLNGSAGASVDANAEVGAGYQAKNTTESSSEGSTTAKTSTIKSGGNLTRSAEGKITDEGTQIEAGGDFTQDSAEWESKAAKNTSYSTSSSETNSGKIGAYAEAGAGAGASVDGRGKMENESGAEASAGVKASYSHEANEDSSASSDAVVSTIKSGGKMTTTSSGKTSLEGTNLESGGDMELNAGSLDYKAAKNTASSSSDDTTAGADLKLGIDATKAVTFAASGDYEHGKESETSSTAVTGSMNSGGKLKVNTKDDARFEGTNIESANDASIKAGGNVTFDAARDEASTSGDAENASASLSISKGKGKGGSSGGGKGSKGVGLEAEGGMEHSESTASDAVTGSIKSGGKLDISAGKNATFEGTQLDSAGDMGVDAKGDVNFNAAKSTSSESGYDASANISASKGGKDAKGKPKGSAMGVGVEGGYNKSDETTSEASGLKSGGNISVKSGNDVNLEGTNIESEGKTSIDAKRDVNFKAKTDTSDSLDVGGSLGLSKTKAAKGGDKAENGSEMGISAHIAGGTSTSKTGGSVKAGEIEVNSGRNATFEGTKMDSKGDTSVKAGGDVTFDAAKSSSIDGSFSGGVGSGGAASIGDAGIGGGVQYDGATTNSGGNLNIESGGKTSFEGTKANADGTATINAKGGVDKKTTVSGGGQIGMSRLGAEIDVQETEINAKSGTKINGETYTQKPTGLNAPKQKIEDAASSVQKGVAEIPRP